MLVESPIICPGIHRVFAEQAQPTNAEVTDKQRVEISSSRSNPTYLEQVIFNPYHERNIASHPLENGGKVSVLWQLQPWQAGAAMISVSNEAIETHSISTDENNAIPVQFVYENEHGYTQEHRIGYAREILRLMDAMSEIHLFEEQIPEGFPPVVAMENAISELGQGRTLSTQHAAVIKNGVGNVDAETKTTFSRELRLSKRLQQTYPHKTEYMNRVSQAMKEQLGYDLDFSLRTNIPPFGYTMSLPIFQAERLDLNAEKFADITEAHYFAGKNAQNEAYTLLSDDTRRRIKERGAIDTYAYTHYFYYLPDDNGREQLHFTASPTIFGGATIENAGGELDRNEHNELPYTIEEESEYKQRVKERMNNQDLA